MKQRGLTLAIRNIVWAELALSAAMAGPVFAQSQTATAAAATSGASATAATDTPASASATAAAPAAASGASAASASGSVQKMQGIQVTGSLIRSSDKVGFNQVQKVTQKDIQDSGAVSVADYLRDTAANSANSWNEGQSGNFAAGASGIALRGLSEKYTLVLVDGQRVTPYAFYSNSVDSFFDLNTLPLNIIDHIDIVKTGAVSEYGSDAVAGVVNIITKHNYQGLQLDGNLGSSVDGHGGNGTGKFGILGGFGNLTSDGYNFTVAASVYKTNGSSLADRDATANEDFSNLPGGSSLLAPSYWTTASGSLAALSSCPYGSTVKSAATNASTAGSTGTICGYNAASQMSIVPESERANAKIHGDFKIDDNTTAFVDFWESYNQTKQNQGVWKNTVDGSTLVYDASTGLLSGFNNTVPASNPYNPYGTATALTYTFPKTVTDTTNSEFWRASTGVKGSFSLPHLGDWDWQTSYGHSESIVDNTISNQLNAKVLEEIYQDGTYDFANPSATPNATNGLYMDATNIAVSKLDVVDATLSTPNLFHLPTGDVGFGIGAQAFHQTEDLREGYESTEGLIVNPDLQTVNGARSVGAVYYQFDIPLLRNLTFSQSGRYDHYSDVGGAFSPRFALRYQPVSAFTTYASYSRGFRAPTFVEDGNSKSLGYQTDPSGDDVTTVTEGNSKLEAERTKNFNIGFQLSPARNTDLGFDWYRIHIDNVIGENWNTATAVTDSSGNVEYYELQYQNLGSLDTSGFEASFRQALPTKIGTFTLSADWAYVDTFWFSQDGTEYNGAGNNLLISQPFGGSFPRWRGNTTLSWAWHKWNAALTWLYTGPYTQAIDTSAGNAGKVASYSQFNLMMTYSGFKNWTVYGGVNNLFNRVPPWDSVWAYSLSQTGYDQSLYEYYGRYVQIGATYKF
ncbi:TonB-dependent receptor [Paraburkholderia phosphatilytica]|uniref:TonB-dependent receptor n=1 Tax=Paraburkholderia phosphatilytica TaxID=2282883 RepID=UPI000E4C4DAD|nr:TonB-dependent receptor [Paraburkholderia phosphatilytica]